MSFPVPRPAPYTAAQQPADPYTRQPPPQQWNPGASPSPSPLPQPRPGGEQSPSPLLQPPGGYGYNADGTSRQTADGVGYNADGTLWRQYATQQNTPQSPYGTGQAQQPSPLPQPRGYGPPPPQPSPPPRSPVDATGASGGYGGGGPDARGAGIGGGYGGGGPEARGGESAANPFGQGMGAQHPVDVFHQMVQHPHGQAILQSQGWTPPQQPQQPQPEQQAGPEQQRPTPSVPNPGLWTPRQE